MEIARTSGDTRTVTSAAAASAGTPGIPLSARPVLAVFGGSFDPVHNGHLFLAGEVLRLGAASEVLFVPARHPPHKPSRILAAPEHRLQMLRAALAPYREFSLSDIELRRADGPSYTFDSLETLRAVYPERELRFMLGMDNLASLHDWHRATELVQRYGLIVLPRPGVNPPSFAALAGHFGGRNARRLVDSVLDVRLIPIGSTEIRDTCARGRSLAGMVPESVLEYISEQGVYQGGGTGKSRERNEPTP